MIKITRSRSIKKVYHGCGNGYLDGTRKIVPKNRKCLMKTYFPF